jgi:hypothetical protein
VKDSGRGFFFTFFTLGVDVGPGVIYQLRMSETNNTAAKGSARAYNAPTVDLYEALEDPRGFFEAVLGFDEMAGRWFRLTAATQRRFFGNVPFGRRAIMVDAEGVVSIFKTQAFGQDFDIWKLRFDHSAKAWVGASDNHPLNALPCNL